MSWRVLALLACMAAAGAAFAGETEDLAEFGRLGNAMYEQDIRAARASDMVLAGKVVPPGVEPRGWIVESGDGSQLMRFVGEKDGTPVIYADILFKGKEAGVLTPRESLYLNAAETAQYHARQTVMADLNAMAPQGQLCSKAYNLISLPAEDGTFRVWGIAATTDADRIQVGGHFRYRLSGDGLSILKKEALFRSCLAFKRSDVPANSQAVGLFMSWLVSDTPLEIHVFLQRYEKQPFFVGTVNNKIVWKVENGSITRDGKMP